MTVYLSSAYLAPVEYYTKLLAYDQIYIEQHDHYTKQTYRNRCTIAAPDGELALSFPQSSPTRRNARCVISVSPTTATGVICTGMPLNRHTTIHLSLNITKMISALFMKRNMSF